MTCTPAAVRSTVSGPTLSSLWLCLAGHASSDETGERSLSRPLPCEMKSERITRNILQPAGQHGMRSNTYSLAWAGSSSCWTRSANHYPQNRPFCPTWQKFNIIIRYVDYRKGWYYGFYLRELGDFRQIERRLGELLVHGEEIVARILNSFLCCAIRLFIKISEQHRLIKAELGTKKALSKQGIHDVHWVFFFFLQKAEEFIYWLNERYSTYCKSKYNKELPTK